LDPRVYDTLLEIAIVEPEKRALNREVWAGLEVLYYLMIRPLLDPDDAEERAAKSLEVQDQAVTYVDAFAAAVGRQFCTLYMHHILVHIPRQVRDLELDLTDVSQQGFENLLKQGKTDMRLFSNKQLKNERQQFGRNAQVIGKEKERIHLKRILPVPPTRNEKRCLAGEKSLQASTRATVDRAERRGHLRGGLGLGISKGKQTLEKRIDKSAQQLQAIVHRIQLVRSGTVPAAEESDQESDEEPEEQGDLTNQFGGARVPFQGSAPLDALPIISSESTRPPVGGTAVELARGAEEERTRAEAGMGLGGGLTAGAAAGSAAGAAAGRGGRGRARGGRAAPAGRGRSGGRTALGRRIPASATI
jgi:hypothetical protein